MSQISEFDSVQKVEEALRSPPPVSSRPNTVAGVDADGYGIRFIICLLKTIAAGARTGGVEASRDWDVDSAVASYVPARRAAAVDPLSVLRAE